MKKVTSLGILIYGSLFVAVSWIGYAFLTLHKPVEKWAVFGEKFGALSTLFTGIASVVVVAALWHEREGAAEREREHRELIVAMRAQVAASSYAARIAAITARIDGYNTQLQGTRAAPDEDRARMIQEQTELFKMLDDAYQNPPKV